MRQKEWVSAPTTGLFNFKTKPIRRVLRDIRSPLEIEIALNKVILNNAHLPVLFADFSKNLSGNRNLSVTVRIDGSLRNTSCIPQGFKLVRIEKISIVEAKDPKNRIGNNEISVPPYCSIYMPLAWPEQFGSCVIKNGANISCTLLTSSNQTKNSCGLGEVDMELHNTIGTILNM